MSGTWQNIYDACEAAGIDVHVTFIESRSGTTHVLYDDVLNRGQSTTVSDEFTGTDITLTSHEDGTIEASGPFTAYGPDYGVTYYLEVGPGGELDTYSDCQLLNVVALADASYGSPFKALHPTRNDSVPPFVPPDQSFTPGAGVGDPWTPNPYGFGALDVLYGVQLQVGG